MKTFEIILRSIVIISSTVFIPILILFRCILFIAVSISDIIHNEFEEYYSDNIESFKDDIRSLIKNYKTLLKIK